LFNSAALALAACASSTPPLATAQQGVVFTYPVNGQLDVPVGSRIVVTFSDKVEEAGLGSFQIVGPAGAVAAQPAITGDGKTVEVVAPLDEGTQYSVMVGAALAPDAENLPAGPLFSFTTRNTRPRAGAPSVIAIDGSPADAPGTFRPLVQSSTIRLVFSEPLDPRSINTANLALVDTTTSTAVATTLVAGGIHVAVDPVDDLVAGDAYELRLNGLVDLGGEALAATTFTLMPQDALAGGAAIPQVLRTKQDGDPGRVPSRAGGMPNAITIDKPLIGKETENVLPSALAAELGDPKALGGPIAFTIRRGQRLHASGLAVQLGGEIPVGVDTGDIEIELLTDGQGRIYRNPYQPADQRPENLRAPLYVDLTIDAAVYAVDPTGSAVLTQSVLGLQATGTAVADDGVLEIESVGAMELGLLGVTVAPSNLVLDLITDPSAQADTDSAAPTLVSTFPAESSAELFVDEGVELVFSEPIDLDKARAGAIKLVDPQGAVVPSVIESHGAAVVVRSTVGLADGTTYRVQLAGVSDVAGNALADSELAFATPKLVGTGTPMTVLAIHPGAPCALANGHCAGGGAGDDVYQPFSLAADEPIEVAFSSPPVTSSMARGTACGTGAIRVEEVDGAGTCVAPVPGTLERHDRTLAFVPDHPWTVGTHYRLVLNSGGNGGCDAGELCGFLGGNAASFDPLAGAGGAGGPALVADFVATPPTHSTYLFADALPATDENGSGRVESGELRRDENRVALRITGTTGDLSNASFQEADCIPGTPETEACIYIVGAMPVEMGEISSDCGGVASRCIPIALTPQAMYGTSVSLKASLGVSISTDTGTSVIRVREPAVGYLIDDGGKPTMVANLSLYMDAPDMSIPLSSHDLHSKQLSASLRGPVSVLPDGRIAIALTNTADVPVEVNVDAPLGLGGSVQMIIPQNEMHLQLVSRPLRGGPR
jgi:methionine-rich copper-binding protein CopC